jgi:hypothetical protein
MSEIKLFIGPPLSGKTDALIEELSKVDPFEYIFIGSQGEFVKFAGNLATQKIGAINRSAFKTIDQFAVYNVKKAKNIIFADKALKLSILTSVIEEMTSRNLDLPKEIQNEAKIVKHRSTVEKLLSLIDDIKTYMKEEEFKSAETMRDLFIVDVMDKMKAAFEKYHLFDSYDAYKMIADREIEISGKYLFIDGFYDFTPIVSEFFKTIISRFDKVFITATEGEIFQKGTSTILNTLEGFKYEKIHTKFKGSEIARGLFFGSGNGLKIYEFEKATDEIEWVAGDVKQMLMDGKQLGDFEIVVKSENNDYIKKLQDKFEEYSISTSYLGHKRMLQNTVIQQLMLPLRVVTGGYPQDLLISLVMAGFAGVHSEFDLIYDLAHLRRGPLRLSHSGRLKNWMERLDSFEKYLSKKAVLLSNEREDLIDKSALEEVKRIEKLVVLAKDTVKNLFDFLKDFEKASEISAYSEIFEGMINKLTTSKKMSTDDLNAIAEFRTLIFEMENIFNFMGIKEMDNSEYRYYIEMQIKDETYTPEEKADAVRISDLLTSRFNHVPIKIFVDFTDGNYPSFQPNYFYNSVEEEKHFGTNRMMKRLLDDRLDLYTATSHAGEVYMTMPISTQEGVRILPSLYLSELERNFNILKERGPLLPPMSVQESIITYAKSSQSGVVNKEFEHEYGLDLFKRRKVILEDEENLDFCDGLAKKPVSFYKFSTYDQCPMRYFFSYVMEIPQTIKYDLDLDSLELGTVYHNVLRKLISEIGREGLRRLNTELRSKIAETVKAELEKVSFFEMAIFEINLLKLTDTIFNYLCKVELNEDFDLKKRSNIKDYKIYMENKEGQPFVPYKFELGFGMKNSEIDSDINGIKFVGRIDRVDLCNSGVMIVDYKSKNAGDKQQLALYSMIYEKAFDQPVLRAVFSTIENAEVKNVMNREKILEIEDELISGVNSFLESSKSGEFTPKACKDTCRICDFNETCFVRWPDGTFKCPK